MIGQAIHYCVTTPKRQEMVMERKKDVGLSKGIGGESLEDTQGRGWLVEYRWGGLGQPICGPPLEKLESAPHFFFEEFSLFTPTLAPGIRFRPLEPVCCVKLLKMD